MIMGCNNMVDFLEWHIPRQLPGDGCFSLELLSFPGQTYHLCIQSTPLSPVNTEVSITKMDKTHCTHSHIGLLAISFSVLVRPRPIRAPSAEWLHSEKLHTFSQGWWMPFLLSQRYHLLWSSWIRTRCCLCIVNSKYYPQQRRIISKLNNLYLYFSL